jgi:hypothetical protein
MQILVAPLDLPETLIRSGVRPRRVLWHTLCCASDQGIQRLGQTGCVARARPIWRSSW